MDCISHRTRDHPTASPEQIWNLVRLESILESGKRRNGRKNKFAEHSDASAVSQTLINVSEREVIK